MMVIMNIYQIIASEYRELFPSSLLKVDFTMRYVRPYEEASILDIGCASGEFLCQLASPGRKLSGIDIDSAMIAEASAFAAENIHFLQADMTGFLQKSRESEYDLVTCFGNTVVYLKDEDALNTFFNGALKALKKGGRIIIQVLNFGRKDIGEGFTFEPLESCRLGFDRFYSLNEDGVHLDFHTSVTDRSPVRFSPIPMCSIHLQALPLLIERDRQAFRTWNVSAPMIMMPPVNQISFI